MKARVALLGIIAAIGSAAAVACVLADPPPIVTPPPQPPPAIITDAVTPPLSQTLQTTCGGSPDCFAVPVLVDPNASVKWRVFVDLDPKGSPGQDARIKEQDDGGVLGVGNEAGPNVRLFSFGLPPSLGIDLTQCHTFTFIVAYDFYPDDFSKPLPPGGDTATWIYQPIADCNYYDGGPAYDASDGATE